MGTFEQGFMGPFRGKLGTAVGSKWKGLYVLRSRPPRKRSGPLKGGSFLNQVNLSHAAEQFENSMASRICCSERSYSMLIVESFSPLSYISKIVVALMFVPFRTGNFLLVLSSSA